MNKSQLRQIIREEIINELSAGEEAKKRGLVHKGWGRYADKSGKIVAKSQDGKLVALKQPEEPTKKKSKEKPAGGEKSFEVPKKAEKSMHHKVANVVKAFEKATGNALHVSRRSHRTWTRGDGSRYKEWDVIKPWTPDRHEDIDKLWNAIKKSGKHIGYVGRGWSGNKRDPVYSHNGVIYVKRGDGIEYATKSRLRNTAVWSPRGADDELEMFKQQAEKGRKAGSSAAKPKSSRSKQALRDVTRKAEEYEGELAYSDARSAVFLFPSQETAEQFAGAETPYGEKPPKISPVKHKGSTSFAVKMNRKKMTPTEEAENPYTDRPTLKRYNP